MATTSPSGPPRAVGDEDPWAPVRAPPPETFLARYRKQAFEFVRNAYVSADRSLRIASAGSLSINLCEDVVYLLKVQVGALDEYLSALSTSPPEDERGRVGVDLGEIRAEGVSSLLHALYVRQIASRDAFFIDLEGCYAAANDFFRLAEALEEWAEEGERAGRRDGNGCDPSSPLSGRTLSLGLMNERELPDLIRLLVSDADYAVRLSCRFALDDLVLHETGSFGLFEQGWEQEEDTCCTGGRSAVASAALSSLLGMVEDYMQDSEEYIGEKNLYRKAIEAAIQRTAVVYTECLLSRMRRVRLRRESVAKARSRRALVEGSSEREDDGSDFPFADPVRASQLLREDIYAIKAFFRSWVLEMPAIDRIIERELTVSSAVQECLGLAGDVMKIGSARSCVFVTALFESAKRNAAMVRGLILDTWGLSISIGMMVVLPSSIEEEISRVASTFHWSGLCANGGVVSLRFGVPGMNIYDLLVRLYASSDESDETHSSHAVALRGHSISRREAAKALKAEFRVASAKLRTVPLSRKKAKKKAKAFLKNCKRATKLSYTG